jgi:iron complex transport system substrate-binding protein
VPKLEKIAPVVVIPWQENSLEVYRLLADAAGRLEAFEARRARYEARIEALSAWIGDPGRISVTMLQAWDGQLGVYRNYGAFGQVVADVGFAEPPLVANLPRTGATLSAELLPQIDADFVFDTFEPNFGDTPQAARARMDRVLPGWCRRLFACRNGQYVLLPRTRAASNAFAAYDFVINQLTTHIAGREYVLFHEQAASGGQND